MKFILFLLAISIFSIPTTFAVAKGNPNESPPGQAKKEQHASVGKVEQVTSDSVIVEDKKNKTKSETVVDSFTKVIGNKKKNAKLKDLKVNDKVAVISTDSGSLKRKKAIKIFVKTASESAQLKRKALQGIIQSISGSQVTLSHQIQQDRQYSFVLSANTIVKFKSQILTSSALQVGQRIAMVGELTSIGFVARLIHIIPGKAIGVFNKNPISTPSGSLTPTIYISPSTTPSATLTPSSTPSATPTI